MGDFNINYEYFVKEYKRNGTGHWKYGIFKDLLRLNMFDTIDLYHDITPTTPYTTFHPNNTSLTKTRIDFVWISENLITESIYSNLLEAQLYNTDHKAVYASFNTSDLFER